MSLGEIEEELGDVVEEVLLEIGNVVLFHQLEDNVGELQVQVEVILDVVKKSSECFDFGVGSESILLLQLRTGFEVIESEALARSTDESSHPVRVDEVYSQFPFSVSN